MRIAVCALAMMLSPGVGLACLPFELPATLSVGDVEVSPNPAGIRAGQQFSLNLKPGAGVAIKHVDATMPGHGHGMNYQPRLTNGSDGAVTAEGLLFHMAGKWQLVIDVVRDGKAQQLTAEVDICP